MNEAKATAPWSTVRREAEDLLGERSEEVARPSAEDKGLAAIYAILEERFESGESEVAAEYDKHQP